MKTRIKLKVCVTKVVLVALVFMLAVSLVPNRLHAAPAVTITSPTAGQTIDSANETITGTATPNRTVIVSVDNHIVGTVVVDGSGNWSLQVANLTSGAHTISAKVIANDYYAYFGATNGTNTINRLQTSDDTLNTGGGWPIVTTNLQFLSAGPRPTQKDKMYWLQVGVPVAAPSLFDLSAPADPVTVSSYTSSPDPDVYPGAFNIVGTKYYSPNNGASSVSVVDVSSNAQAGSIPIGGIPQVATLGISGNIYVSPANGNNVAIINTSSDTVVKTIPLACSTANSLGSVQFVEDRDYYLVACTQDGIIYKLDSTTDAVISSWDISATQPTVAAVISYPGFSKGYAFGTYGTPSANKVTVIDLASGAVTKSFTLSAASFSGIVSPDGQYIYAATPGAFDTTNIDKISTATDEVVETIDTSAVGVPGNVTYGAVESATSSVGFIVNLSSSSNHLAETGQGVPTTTLGGFLLLSAALATTISRRKYVYRAGSR